MPQVTRLCVWYKVISHISAVLSGHSLTLLEILNELSYLCIIIQ